jgi:hypothetical protein
MLWLTFIWLRSCNCSSLAQSPWSNNLEHLS